MDGLRISTRGAPRSRRRLRRAASALLIAGVALAGCGGTGPGVRLGAPVVPRAASSAPASSAPTPSAPASSTPASSTPASSTPASSTTTSTVAPWTTTTEVDPASTTTAPPNGPVELVTVNLTPQGCPPSPASVSAGEVEFRVTNVDAVEVNEAEVWTSDWHEMMGEKEGVHPGFGARFYVDMPAGSYVINCPGGTQGHWPFTVTGAA